jgi:hypothetical protein
MAGKIYRIASLGLLLFCLISVLLVLRRPALPQVEVSAEAARSFDEKIAEINQPRQERAPGEIHLTESELNSKLQESLQAPVSVSSPIALRGATVHLKGNELVGIFTVNISGKDVYVTIGGTLGGSNGLLQFTPLEVKMGSLPIPVSAVKYKLREKLDSPEMRDRMKLPELVKDIRVENSEVVIQIR